MTTLTENKLDWEQASELLQDAKSVLIVTHVNPDGDAVGSMLGLANALRAWGKRVDTAVDNGAPAHLSFLDGSKSIYAKITTGKWDLLISVDASDTERIGGVGAYGRHHTKAVINLDHHPSNDLFGDVHLVQIDAVSATEIIYHWLVRLGLPLDDKAVTRPLLTGLVTDTMGFRTSNVTAKTLQIAQHLMESGVSIHEITTRTLDSKPYHAVKLWGQALQSIDLDNQIVAVDVTQDNLKAAGLTDVSDSGLVGILNQIEEARVAVIFWELTDNRVKLSLRSKQGYDVGSVATELGGGGHTQAAGATIDGTLTDAHERVLPMLKKAVDAGAATFA